MRRSTVAALALVAMILCLAAFWGANRARRPRAALAVASVEFLDVGQGDSILIRSPEGKSALVDAGPSGRVVELLRARGITALDLVVVSHHHLDHYGGMPAVIRAFRPRVFLDADSPHATPMYVKLLEQVRSSGITAIRAGPKSRKIDLGSVAITVFPRAPTDEKEENNNSIGLRVDYGATSALLTGDSQGSERRWWMKNCPGLIAEVQVLKLAHHGSRNGTDPSWLELARPSIAVASLGKDNSFGHPHPETLDRLRSAGIPLLRTDELGSISFRTDGRVWSRGESTLEAPPRREAEVEVEAAVSRGGRPAIDLNRAPEELLRTIPGVGPARARRIIEGRPYRSVDDLGSIPEIGARRLEEIRPYLTVD